MSHRTIVEFNHDCLDDMENDPHFWPNLLMRLKTNDWKGRFTKSTQGVQKVGERHHSEPLVIYVNGHRIDPQ